MFGDAVCSSSIVVLNGFICRRLGGFKENIAVCSLLLAKTQNRTNTIIKMNSLCCIRLILKASTEDPRFNFVYKIQQLLYGTWINRLKHTWRVRCLRIFRGGDA